MLNVERLQTSEEQPKRSASYFALYRIEAFIGRFLVHTKRQGNVTRFAKSLEIMVSMGIAIDTLQKLNCVLRSVRAFTKVIDTVAARKRLRGTS